MSVGLHADHRADLARRRAENELQERLRAVGSMMVAISTRNLDALPDIDGLRRLSQSLAMLDAIIQPEWQFRYHSFNAHWGHNEMMGSMRNGSGDDYFILFNRAGAIIKGYAHESTMASYVDDGRPHWPGVLDQVPQEFVRALAEPAFAFGSTSFCIWRLYSESAWSIGDISFPAVDQTQYQHLSGSIREVVESWARDHDGSEHMLFRLDDYPMTYKTWAAEYYGREVPLAVIERLYRHEPLTNTLVAALNPALSLAVLQSDIREIGYPATEEC